MVRSFLVVWQNLQNLRVLGSVIAAWGLAANQSSGGEKNCIAYSLFCIFVIIIINNISISFVVLLNCLYLNP